MAVARRPRTIATVRVRVPALHQTANHNRGYILSGEVRLCSTSPQTEAWLGQIEIRNKFVSSCSTSTLLGIELFTVHGLKVQRNHNHKILSPTKLLIYPCRIFGRTQIPSPPRCWKRSEVGVERRGFPGAILNVKSGTPIKLHNMCTKMEDTRCPVHLGNAHNQQINESSNDEQE